MITAVDTTVLLDVFGADPTFGAASKEALGTSLDAGRLVVCDLVWVETVAAFPDERAAEDALRELEVTFVATEQRAAARAGTAWRRYRKAGGNRSRLVADFLVGAHALLQADRLLTRDRGFFRTYFEDLTVLDPTEPEGQGDSPCLSHNSSYRIHHPPRLRHDRLTPPAGYQETRCIPPQAARPTRPTH